MSKPDVSDLCCDDLKDVMTNEDFTPLIHRDENGVIYMSVGCVEIEEGGEEEAGIGWLDHAMFHCPFCGTQLQSAEEAEEGTS